jgi:hypothetical protein
MERLFSPCTRLQDILESQGRLDVLIGDDEVFQELNLDVAAEELLSTERAFTYADLHDMLRNLDTVAWLTPHAAVVRGNGIAMRYCLRLNERCRFWFRVDGKDLVALARSPQHLLEICDVVLRLLAVSVVHSVQLTDWSTPDFFINAPILAYLMEQCQSLKVLTLKDLKMDEIRCRVLGDYSRPGLEIVLNDCRITSAGACALAEVLGRNQGPTKLYLCEIDNSVLANGLRGNSRLKSFTPLLSGGPEDGNREVLEIACALKENRGLVDLVLKHYFGMSDETWDAVCDSLETHPTLEVLDFRSRPREALMIDPAVIIPRVQVLLNMLKVNLSIHTIHLDDHYSQHELYRESVMEVWFEVHVVS